MNNYQKQKALLDSEYKFQLENCAEKPTQMPSGGTCWSITTHPNLCRIINWYDKKLRKLQAPIFKKMKYQEGDYIFVKRKYLRSNFIPDNADTVELRVGVPQINDDASYYYSVEYLYPQGVLISSFGLDPKTPSRKVSDQKLLDILLRQIFMDYN